jgi:CHASE2 domain-containing sensor protein
MLPGQDTHRTSHGSEIYGCEVHAQALDEFLDRAYLRRFSRWGLVLRTLLWCCLAGVIAPLVPTGAYGATWFAKLTCFILCALGVAIVGMCLDTSSRWSIEAAIGVSSILVTGSLTYLCLAAWTKLARIAPGPGWPSSHETESPASVGEAG